jgi:hypothetical protein
MPSKLETVQRFNYLLLLLAWAVPVFSQTATGNESALTPAEGQAMVAAALANELKAAQDTSHPMRYTLRKTSPRLTTTKEIFETKDGLVARLTSINDKPLSEADQEKEDARLVELHADPGKQRHRKQAEDADADRALMVLRALPNAFLYQYAGSGESPSGTIQKFTFRPNPGFSPPDLETQVLTQMAGEIWIDAARLRVTRLQGRLQQDVDFGWGILGRLNKGGWITIDQADVGGGQWRIVHFQMQMSGRVVFRTRVFDTTEDETHFAPLPAGLGYQKAIDTLRGDPK